MPQTNPITESQWRALPNPADQVRLLPLPISDRKLRLFGCLCLQRCRESLSLEGRDALDVAERFAHGLATNDERQAAFRRLVEGCGGYIGPHPVGRPWCTASLPHDLVAIAVALVIAAPEETLLDLEHGRLLLNTYEDVKQMQWVAQSCQLARSLAEAQARARAEEVRSADRVWGRLIRAVSGWFSTSEQAAIIQHELDYQSALVREIFGNPFRPVMLSPDWCTDTVLTLARQMDETAEYSALPILADALQDAGCDNDDLLTHCRDKGQAHVRGCWAVDLVLGRE